MNIWQTLPKPIMALAPMEDVTDTVFRRIVAGIAPADIYFTEFTNVEGLLSKGNRIVSQRLLYTENERPLIAQIWGNKPESFFQVAQMLVSQGFDGIDINMGCPEKSVVSHGSGACLIAEPNLVGEIISATREGIAKTGEYIPLSVKTRIGYKKIAPEWIPFLLEQKLDALTIHGRTAAEMSKVPAHWDEIGKAVDIRNQMNVGTLILGNGDVPNYTDAILKCKTYGVDGVMIGRGIFHDVWAFDKNGESHMNDPKILTALLLKHVRLFDEVWGETKNFAVMKKFFKIYVQGYEHASDFRDKLMQVNSKEEIEAILESFEANSHFS